MKIIRWCFCPVTLLFCFPRKCWNVFLCLCFAGTITARGACTWWFSTRTSSSTKKVSGIICQYTPSSPTKKKEKREDIYIYSWRKAFPHIVVVFETKQIQSLVSLVQELREAKENRFLFLAKGELHLQKKKNICTVSADLYKNVKSPFCHLHRTLWASPLHFLVASHKITWSEPCDR